jgi:multiple sugar transport system permease protein
VVGRTSLAGRLTLYTLLVVVLAVMTFPFFQLVSTALAPTADLFAFPPPWLPSHLRFENFIDVWRMIPLRTYFINTVEIAGGTMLLNALAAIPAAYALARFRFPGRRAVLYTVIATQMFAPVVLLIASFRLMSQLGLLNTLWGLIFMDTATTVPFTVWMLTGYFAAIPREIEEAAILDRVGRWRRLIDLFIPLSMPGIVTALVFTFILAWNEFLFAVTFVTNDTARPLTSGLYSFVGRFSTQWNYLMAGSAMATVPVLLLFLVIQRRLIAGLTAGAVK